MIVFFSIQIPLMYEHPFYMFILSVGLSVCNVNNLLFIEETYKEKLYLLDIPLGLDSAEYFPES